MKALLILGLLLAASVTLGQQVGERERNVQLNTQGLRKPASLPGKILWAGQRPTSLEDEERVGLIVRGDDGVSTSIPQLEKYVQENPVSGWSPSIRANLAAIYREQGRFSPALNHWRQALDQLEGIDNRGAKATKEFIIAKQARLLASLGRHSELVELHNRFSGTTFEDPAHQVEFQSAMEAMTIMSVNPGRTYRCGPLALLNVAKFLKFDETGSAEANYDTVSTPSRVSSLLTWRSPTNGFSFGQLQEACDRIGLNFNVYRRKSDTNLIAPAVIHWKQNHFAALLEVKGNACLIVDPTFGFEEKWISMDVLNSEMSGYILCSKGSIDENWAEVNKDDADEIRGQGLAISMDDSNDQYNPKCKTCGSGMPYWWISEPYINLWMQDAPLSWTTSAGEELSFGMYYKQREMRSFPTFGSATVPISKWNHGWLKWVEIEDTYAYPPIVAKNSASTTVYRGNWSFPVTIPYNYGSPSGQILTTVQAPSPFSNPTTYDNGVVSSYLPIGGCVPVSANAYTCDSYKYIAGDLIVGDPSWLFMNWRAKVYNSEGGQISYSGNGTGSVSNSRNRTTANMVYGGGPIKEFVVNYPDGSSDVFGQIERNSILNNEFKAIALITKSIAPNGRTTRYIYETSPLVRLKQVEDPDGRRATLTYGGAYPNQVTMVEDPYGRKAKLEYYSDGSLKSIIDAVNITNTFTYNGNLISTLTTPYGATTFSLTEQYITQPTSYGSVNHVVNRGLVVNEPEGAKQIAAYIDGGTEMLLPANVSSDTFTVNSEYVPIGTPIGTLSPGNPANLPNGAISHDTAQNYNSFYWGRKQASALSSTSITSLVASDFIKARRRHWLAENPYVQISDCISYEIEPSADTINIGPITWFDYVGKPVGYPFIVGTEREPAVIARRIPGGETSYAWIKRNSLGHPYETVSTYTTAGGIVGTRTSKVSYQNLIYPKTVEGADGDIEVAYGYNSYNQISWITNALGTSVQEIIERQYDSVTRRPILERNHTTRLNKSWIWPSGTNGFISEIRVWKDNGSGTFLEGYHTNSFTWSGGLVQTHTSPLGLVRTLSWDDLQRLRKVSYPDSTYITNGYTYLDLTLSVDRLGNTNRVQYNSLQQVVAQVDQLNRTNLFVRCSCGLLDSIKNSLQQTVSFVYDNAGKLVAEYLPESSPAFYEYDTMFRLKKVTDETGSINLTYNNQGLVQQIDGPLGKIASVVYDKEDRQQTVVDRNGVSSTRQFDPLDRIRNVTWPDTGTESWGYTAGYSSPTSYTNQIGKAVNSIYDPLQRKAHEWVVGIYTNRFFYNPESSLSQLIDGNGNITRWGFDAYGRTIAKTNASGQLVWTNAFNANGWQTAHWTPSKGLIRFGYDVAGNRVGITNPASPSIVFGYDALNRVTNIVDGIGVTAFGYSSFGKLAFEDGPWASDRISYGYDSVRRLTGIGLQQPSGEWAQTFSYDNAGRMVGTVSPAGAFVYEYSTLSGFAPDRISRLRLPNSGWIDNDYDSLGRRTGTRLVNSSSSVLNRHDYVLDLAGNRKKVTLSSGNTWDYTYDDSGQLLTAVGKESGGANRLHEQLQYRYDASGNLTNRTSDALQFYISANARNEIVGTSRSGSLTVAGSVTAPASSVLVNGSAATRYADNSWAKGGNSLANGINTFTAVATQTGTGTQDTTVSSINLPSSPSFAYDANGNLLWDGLKSFSYDDQDQLVTVHQAGQWRSEFSYDGLRRRRISKEYTWSGAATGSLISNGTLTASLRNDFTGFVGASITVGSSPIVVSELGRWKISGNSGSHFIKLVRANDKTEVPGGSVTVILSAGSVGTFVYGTLPAPITLEPFTTYYLICQEYLSGDTWYNENQPVVAISGLTVNSAIWQNGSGTFFTAGSSGTSYGTLSMKGAVGSWSPSSETRYIYDSNLVVQERNGSNNPTVSYTRGLDLAGGRQSVGGIGGLLAHTTHGSPNIHQYYHADSSGNITALVNVQNQLSARYSYDPFGNSISISGPMADGNKYRFSSKEVHQQSGLISFGYRFYEPYHQRWLNNDPISENGGLNLYQFSRNRPTMAVDPDGRGVWEELDDYYIGDWISQKIYDEAIGDNRPLYDPNSNLAQRYREGIGSDDFDLGDGERKTGGELAAEVLSIPITACADALLSGGVGRFVDFASDGIGSANLLGKSSKRVVCEIKGACFIAGTLVATECGNRPIEEIEPGDLVWSWNEATGEIALKEVVATMVHDDIEIVHIDFECDQIEATPAHPFWVENRGWTDAALIQVGDIVKTIDGYAKVAFACRLSTRVSVYNFEVADFHTYYVAPSRILVHNAGGSKMNNPFAQNLAERQKSINDLIDAAKKEYPGKADGIEKHHITPKYLGGDPDGPTVPLNAAYHQKITNAFRERWPYGGGLPSETELKEIMEEVYNQYPLPLGY